MPPTTSCEFGNILLVPLRTWIYCSGPTALVATIPRGDLVLGRDPTGKVESSRHFFFEDEARHLIISSWFESEKGFPGIREFWEGEMKRWRDNGLPATQAVSFARISDCRQAFGKGLPLSMAAAGR